MGTGGVEARTILWYLTFTGFAVNFMMRFNTNLTIVAMVKTPPSVVSAAVNPNITKCFDTPRGAPLGNVSAVSTLAEPFYVLEKAFLRSFEIPFIEDGFSWDAHQRNLLLGSSFWINWVSQIPGGILGRKYGTKIVFGVSNLMCGLLCFLMPLASYMSFEMLLLIRAFQGLISGFTFPSMHAMAGRWIPPNERSKFVTAYLGNSLGIAIAYPLFGFVISWTSWEWVYHICGVLSIVWFVTWWYFAYDSPAEHPRISQEERNYIEKSLGNSVQKKAGPIPWKAILSSRAVWVTIICHFGGNWGLFTLMTQAPSYLRLIHDLPIEWTGILSGVPHLMRIPFAICFSIFADWLLRTEKLTRANVRKLAGFVSGVINGLFILLLAYSGCNTTAAIVFLALGTMVQGAVSSGPLANLVDLSPNHAGVLLGISGMIASIPGFVSPVIVGFLTKNNQTPEQWKKVFNIAALLIMGSGSLYVFFASSSLKPWNSSTKKRKDLEDASPAGVALLDMEKSKKSCCQDK